MFKKTFAVFFLTSLLALNLISCKKKDSAEEGLNSEGMVAPAKSELPAKIQGSVVPAPPSAPTSTFPTFNTSGTVQPPPSPSAAPAPVPALAPSVPVAPATPPPATPSETSAP